MLRVLLCGDTVFPCWVFRWSRAFPVGEDHPPRPHCRSQVGFQVSQCRAHCPLQGLRATRSHREQGQPPWLTRVLPGQCPPRGGLTTQAKQSPLQQTGSPCGPCSGRVWDSFQNPASTFRREPSSLGAAVIIRGGRPAGKESHRVISKTY